MFSVFILLAFCKDKKKCVGFTFEAVETSNSLCDNRGRRSWRIEKGFLSLHCMAYVNIILLTLGIIGIVYGTVRLIVAKKYILALIFTLFVSWLAILLLFDQICCNLAYLGFECDYYLNHVPYNTQRFTIRALSFNAYGPLLVFDFAGLAYAALLIILARLGAHAKALKPHMESLDMIYNH